MKNNEMLQWSINIILIVAVSFIAFRLWYMNNVIDLHFRQFANYANDTNTIRQFIDSAGKAAQDRKIMLNK